MLVAAVVTAGLFLAFANGANDNFKGVATLFGSGSASFRRSLAWATLCTGAGSPAALFLARGLLAKFSGKVDFGVLRAGLMAPLLFSPLLAVIGAAALYPLLRRARRRWGVTEESCLCVGAAAAALAPAGGRADAKTFQAAAGLAAAFFVLLER